jgi:vacuolar protein sorting-associated protein 33A
MGCFPNTPKLFSCNLTLKNFNAVGPTLSKKAKAVSAQFEERHGAKTVKDFKLFVDRLPQMQVRKKTWLYSKLLLTTYNQNCD